VTGSDRDPVKKRLRRPWGFHLILKWGAHGRITFKSIVSKVSSLGLELPAIVDVNVWLDHQWTLGIVKKF